MLYTIIPASRSRGIGNGLLYESDDNLKRGSLVRIPLRKKIVEGIIVECNVTQRSENFDIKKIMEIVLDEPLLTQSQIEIMQWMSAYYACSLRQTLQVILPPPPWHLLAPKKVNFYTLSNQKWILKGKKQLRLQEYLTQKEHASEQELMEETGATKATMKNLAQKGILIRHQERSDAVSKIIQAEKIQMRTEYPPMTKSQEKALRETNAKKSPVLILDTSAQDPIPYFIRLIDATWQKQKSVIVLTPDIASAKKIHERMREVLGGINCQLIHGKMSAQMRRAMYAQHLHANRTIIIGSRTALFSPLPSIGLILVIDEQSRQYKNEQAPRYHARNTAEKMARAHNATLILYSTSPSLESWLKVREEKKEYDLVNIQNDKEEKSENAPRTHVSIVDLTTVHFGNAYPFSPQLIGAIDERLKKKEKSILLLNRRGMATALFCLDCKQSILSEKSNLPFSMHTVGGKPYLIDHHSGMVQPVPAHCPQCQSVRLIPIGAGTQGAEKIVQKFFPHSCIVRVDGDTREKDREEKFSQKILQGEADILIGTTAILPALSLPNVTLASVMIADIGLCLPHFRAGERTFQFLHSFIQTAKMHTIRDVMIQTYRPECPEICLAATGKIEQYLDDELALRKAASYPPYTQLIVVSMRGTHAGEKARLLHRNAQKKESGNTVISSAPSLYDAKVWNVFFRGNDPRSLINSLDITDATIDIDAVDRM